MVLPVIAGRSVLCKLSCLHNEDSIRAELASHSPAKIGKACWRTTELGFPHASDLTQRGWESVLMTWCNLLK